MAMFMFLLVVAFGYSLVLPGLPYDYTKVEDGQNGFNLYHCDWAEFPNILAEVISYNDIVYSVTWIPYAFGSYTYYPYATYNHVPPGIAMYPGAGQNGYYLGHANTPGLIYPWYWIRVFKTPVETIMKATSVSIFFVKD